MEVFRPAHFLAFIDRKINTVGFLHKVGQFLDSVDTMGYNAQLGYKIQSQVGIKTILTRMVILEIEICVLLIAGKLYGH